MPTAGVCPFLLEHLDGHHILGMQSNASRLQKFAQREVWK
jgi:hypothetical protein